MKYVAIVISTQYGQTKKIAEHLCDTLRTKQVDPHLFELQSFKDLPSVRPERFDAVVIGAPVYAGHFPKILTEWARKNVGSLDGMPCAFFSVSLNAADKRAKARNEDQRLIGEFLAETGLHPKLTACLIGALHYREYGFLKRWLMKRISASAGGPTDTSRDHDLTDWRAVRDFADEFAKLLPASQLGSDHAPERPEALR